MDLRLYEKYLAEIRMIANKNKQIACHATLDQSFHAALIANPNLIMELGTGAKGLRTQAMCRAAALCDAWLVSVDIKDCLGCGNAWYGKWIFIQAEAREFGRIWPQWAGRKFGESREIDVLFVDLDELYETTLETWQIWNPYLAPKATLMFRCTNLQKKLYYPDGTSTMLGWDNKRGVIRVLEDALGLKFDETREYTGEQNGWAIKHYPWGGGLSILKRI